MNNWIQRTFLLLAVLLIDFGQAYSQIKPLGTIEAHRYIYGETGAPYKNLYVYLPEDYYTSDKHYPVVYLLHGANGNERSWVDKGSILGQIDSLTQSKVLKESIYVFPNMNRYYRYYDSFTSRPKGSIESFLDLNGSSEFSFIEDIMTFVDRTFRTIPCMKHRAIAGLSLGGLQSLYITANTTDSFGYIGLFSPIIYPPLTFGEHSHIYRNLEQKLNSQSDAEPMLYLIMIGEDDPYFEAAYIYSQLLENLQFKHIFIKTPGGHTWENWCEYCTIFLKSLWKESPQGLNNTIS